MFFFKKKELTRAELKECVKYTCRICTQYFQEEKDRKNLISIYDEVQGGENEKFYIHEELSLLNLEVRKSDRLPQFICKICLDVLQNYHKFCTLTKNSQIQLREKIDSTAQIEKGPSGVEIVIVGDTMIKNEKRIELAEEMKKICRACAMYFNKNNEMLIKIPNGLPEYQRNTRTQKFSIVEELILLNIKLYEDDDLPKIICRVCFNITNNIYEFRKLIRNSQTVLRKKFCKLIRKSISKLRYICSMCSSSFPTANSLESHKKIHDKNRRFHCKQCNYCFTKRDHLERHINCKHTPAKYQKRYFCTICGKRFANDTVLYSHKRTQHKMRKIFPCKACGKKFKSLKELICHKSNDHKSIFCKTCGEEFPNKEAYSSHEKTHTVEDNSEPLPTKLIAETDINDIATLIEECANF